nr:hypothetical protein [Tanacetum cinerariifolium]
EKDDTIRHLHVEKDILGLLNVGSTESSFETKALETEIAQLKEGLTSLKIQNDRTSPRSTQKPPVQHKKPTVPVNMFPKAKPATEARKPIPKRNTQNHNPLVAKSVKTRRAADYYRNLYVDINQFVDRSMKSMHTKPPPGKACYEHLYKCLECNQEYSREN